MAKIIKKYYTLYKTADDNNDYFWIKNEGSSSTGYLRVEVQGGWDEPIECSFDKINWWSYKNASYHQWPAGTKLYLRNSSGVFSSSDTKYARFYHSGGSNISIGGDMTTLLNYTLSNTGDIKTLPNYCFYDLFNSSNLLSVDCNIGNVETIGNYSFEKSFLYSTSLESVVFDMSKVKTIKSYGARYMFQNCSGATSIDINLSSLETVENNGMNSMFWSCSNITEGLDLKSVTTVGNYGMQSLYYGCYKLSEATAPNVDTWNQSSTFNQWLGSAGTQATGTKTVNCPTGLSIPTNNQSGIPSGWTRADY